jgi:homoserine O-acetyltransferase
MIVKNQIKELSKPFETENGFILKQPIAAYEEYGNPDGPVIYIAHGGLSDQHAAGRHHKDDPLPGWWDGLIGDDKVFDTKTYRIICANALGGAFGTTSPKTTNVDTGCRYGPNFPQINFRDVARFSKTFLDDMGVDKLFLMAGPSMGSLQSLQMAALYPDFVGAVISVATSGRMTPSGMAAHHLMINALKMDPEFNAGWYELGKPLLSLKVLQQFIRIYYTHEKGLKQIWDSVPEGKNSQSQRSYALENFLTGTLDVDLKDREPNCMITTLNAINSYDLGSDAESYEQGVQRIKCPVLLMNLNTDHEFLPYWAEEVVDILNSKNKGQATVKVLDSIWGHLGCVIEFDQMDEHIRSFLVSL